MLIMPVPGRGGQACSSAKTGGLYCVVSGIIGPALLIFALVRTVEALQDARSERLRSYNNGRRGVA